MPDEVTLDVTTIEENVTVETTAGDVVEIQVVAPTGPTGATGPAGPNSVTSATTSDGTANLSLGDLEVVGGEIYTDGEYSNIYTQGTDAHIFTLGSGAEIFTEGELAQIYTTGASAQIYTAGAGATIGTQGANATIYTLGTNATISTAGSAAHIQTNHASAAVKSTNFAAVESGGASLVDGSMQPCLTWSAGGRNLTIPSGTATTFNTTSYTYGTGAAAAHRTALGLTTLATTTPGTNVANFLEFPTSDNLASALTDENGTGGGFVRAEGATLTTPTFTGSAARANGQNIMPATGDEVINFDSLIVASQYMFAWRQGEILNTVTGSAGANSAGFHATGTTPNSSAYSRYFLSGGYPTYISTGAYPYSGLNWTRRIVLTGAIAVPSSVNSSAAVIRVVLGEAIANTTVRDLVNRGVGLKIESGNIKLMVHNGTTLTIGSAVGTLTNNAQYFRIDSYNGTVKLYINNVLVDTTTSGPTSVGPEALVTQTQNGNVSEAQNFWLTQAKIWTL